MININIWLLFYFNEKTFYLNNTSRVRLNETMKRHAFNLSKFTFCILVHLKAHFMNFRARGIQIITLILNSFTCSYG
jgi:hypothetical protein